MCFTRKFYTADSHFGHALMISPKVGCRRPFADTREMDEFLIAAWNGVVGAEDIVFHLGDFSFGLGDEARVRSIFYRLNGRKRLVIGNHDVRKDGSLHPTLAALDWDAAPVHAMETKDEGQRVHLSHYAHRVWPGAHNESCHFYGHSHGSLEGVGRSRDVGVDCADVGYAPRTFRQLTGEWANQ